MVKYKKMNAVLAQKCIPLPQNLKIIEAGRQAIKTLNQPIF